MTRRLYKSDAPLAAAIGAAGPSPPAAAPSRLLRVGEVMRRTSLARSKIYERMAEKTFPQAVALGKRSVAWFEGEIDEWCAARPRTGRQP